MYIGSALSEDSALFYLTKAKWRNLGNLQLCSLCEIIGGNNITEKGCSYLKEADWPLLQIIDLGYYRQIQKIISLEMEVVSI